MESENKLSFFFLGLGIGAALGILFAPKSGRETRELLRSKASEGKDYLKRKGEELRDSAGDLIDRGKSAILSKKDQLAAAFEAGKQAYRDAVKEPGGGAPEGV